MRSRPRTDIEENEGRLGMLGICVLFFNVALSKKHHISTYDAASKYAFVAQFVEANCRAKLFRIKLLIPT